MRTDGILKQLIYLKHPGVTRSIMLELERFCPHALSAGKNFSLTVLFVQRRLCRSQQVWIAQEDAAQGNLFIIIKCHYL